MKLDAQIKADTELAKAFTSEQPELIAAGKKPDGFTWNHNQKISQMVDMLYIPS